MSFNGAGVFQRLYSWVNDAAANIKIRADRMDNEMDGFAVGLSTCITKNGQTTITNNLPMAGFRHTGVGNAASRSDYASFGQVQDGKAAWVDGGGTADAITASYSIPITALTDGQLCYVRATAANATTTPTFSPNGLTARTIVKNGGQALVAGDIAGDGHELELRYDLTNTRWELMNPKVVIPAPTSVFSDSAFRIQDNGDATKQLAFEVSGISTGTTRTLAPPNFDGTLATLAGTETLTNKTVNLANNTLTTTLAQLNTAISDGEVGIQIGALNSTTGVTSRDFTGIPAGVKRITLFFNQTSTSGTSNLLVQLGDSGGVETTGYSSIGLRLPNAAAIAGAGSVAGFLINSAVATASFAGKLVFDLQEASSNTWVCVGIVSDTNNIANYQVTGTKSLSATLDRVRVTTVGGTDTFDSGSNNISWEF